MPTLSRCGSGGARLADAVEILHKMATNSRCFRVLTLSGAMVPAGMEEIVCQLIERKILHAIVSTGANITHSLLNVLGKSGEQMHYQASAEAEDCDLWGHHIYRIYDTLIPGKVFVTATKAIYTMLRNEFPDKNRIAMTPSELFTILGRHLEVRSFLKVAAQYDVPVFCGATSDSELGINLMKFRETHDFTIILDEIGDIGNFGKLISQYNEHGLIIIGGGVPRNWAQQVFPYLYDVEDELGYSSRFRGYQYSVRFHTALPDDGGCSGCTISENVSWGKYHAGTLHQSVWGDATITFPITITALFQRLDQRNAES